MEGILTVQHRIGLWLDPSQESSIIVFFFTQIQCQSQQGSKVPCDVCKYPLPPLTLPHAKYDCTGEPALCQGCLIRLFLLQPHISGMAQLLSALSCLHCCLLDFYIHTFHFCPLVHPCQPNHEFKWHLKYLFGILSMSRGIILPCCWK